MALRVSEEALYHPLLSNMTQDLLFENMSFLDWDAATRLKTTAFWDLHQNLLKGMDFFILLSLLSGIVGNLGQRIMLLETRIRMPWPTPVSRKVKRQHRSTLVLWLASGSSRKTLNLWL
jgi:hypothetical protein